jgi:glyoxylase-like metal-dependent hydrolase (beta-lactamase superfamily II)
MESGHWVPTFPNARYLMSQREIDHCLAQIARDPKVNHGSFQDSVQPILDRNLHRTVSAGEAIADDATIVSLEGHTPGQIGLELTGDSKTRLLFCGDAIHSPAQVIAPDWSSAFCHDKALSARTRRALLARSASEDIIVVPVHLRGDGMRIRETADRFTPEFIGEG